MPRKAEQNRLLVPTWVLEGPRGAGACLDRLLGHKRELFSYLKTQWQSLFEARSEVLLYDLTSTYFEVEVPQEGKRRFGYSRDQRPDCVQRVIGLILTPEGFPLAYEVLAGNTSDKSTLRDFLARIETQYGKAPRIWVMDRGIPTEEVLSEMRQSDPVVPYLVRTSMGRLTRLEKRFSTRPWTPAREPVAVNRRRLRRLCRRLKELQTQRLTRDALLFKLGAAKQDAGRAYGLIDLVLPKPDSAGQDQDAPKFCGRWMYCASLPDRP